jgi:hypothetical protein
VADICIVGAVTLVLSSLLFGRNARSESARMDSRMAGTAKKFGIAPDDRVASPIFRR